MGLSFGTPAPDQRDAMSEATFHFYFIVGAIGFIGIYLAFAIQNVASDVATLRAVIDHVATEVSSIKAPNLDTEDW